MKFPSFKTKSIQVNTGSSMMFTNMEKYLIFGFTLLFFGYFIIRLFFFATHISHYIPPDEIAHFGICQVFSNQLSLPQNSKETYALGLVADIPYLYYYIMGKCLKLNIFPVPDLIFLRILNCLITLSTVFFGYKWIRLISSNHICHFMFLVLITNTPMFSFIGASVSYDNLTNLFAAMTLYYFHLCRRQAAPLIILLFGISILAGILTKVSFLPLATAFVLLFLIRFSRYLPNLFSIVRTTAPNLRLKEVLLLGVFLSLILLNMTLYVNNLIRYKHLVPEATQVLNEKQAMQYGNTARSMILEKYKSGRLSFDEAVKKVKVIPNKVDQANTIYWLNLVKKNKLNPQALIDRVQFTGIWLRLMLKRSVGIMAHVWMEKKAYEFAAYQLILFFAAFLCIRFWKPSEADGYPTDALILSLSYAGVLAHYVNYNAYIVTLSIGAALQGRYFFPVIVPFYGIGTYYLIHPFKKPFQIVIFIIISGYFIWGDFPYFLNHATSVWFFQ